MFRPIELCMAGRGRDKTVSDVEILLLFILTPEPAFMASEFTDAVDMTRQGVLKRLDDLEDQGYLESKKASGRRMFWITEEGRQFVSESEVQRSSGNHQP